MISSSSPAPETVYEDRLWIEVVPCLLTFFDRYCHLHILCLLRQIFLAADSWELFSSPQRAHVTFFVKRDKRELALWLLCSVHAVIQVPLVHSARLSLLSPRASRAILHSRHPADCILPILVRKLAVGVCPATAIPNRLLRRHGIFLSLRYFPSITLPASCLSMKSATHVL